MKESFRRILTGLMILPVTVTALYSGCRITQILRDRHAARKMNENVQEYVPVEAWLEATDDSGMVIDWDALREICPDIIGWISCPDTQIDYPILQAADNEQYLRRLPDGTRNIAGSIFADYRNTAFSDENTLIYGHNMNDGTMFHDLILWSDADFAAEHPCISIRTPAADYELRLFSARQVTTGDQAYQISFATGEKETWAKLCQQKSYFTPQAVSDQTAPVVTLSTCTADGIDRFVVQGFLCKTE